MSFRKAIFYRTTLLLAGLILICCLGMAAFIIRQNREHWKEHGGEETLFLANQSERLLLWDDPLAMRDMIAKRKSFDEYIAYIFIEVTGRPYAHTFPTGVPAGLLGLRGPFVGGYSQREVQDGEGRVFYDFASPVGGTDAVAHVGISRATVDGAVWGLIFTIAAICGAAWLLLLFPAWHMAGAITREVETSTNELAKLNEHLEARVRERTDELSTANERLKGEIVERERLEREKADFYAMVTHDLKSPLMVIKGYTELLLDEDTGMDQDAAAMIKGIDQSADKLYGIVNEFLTASRIEQGRLALNMSVSDPAGLVRAAAKDVSTLCESKGVTMTTEVEECPPGVLCDQSYLRRAVANLLQNAVNYTPAGGRITLRLQRAADKDGDFIGISVADTGAGIPAGERDKVFEKYYRSATSAGTKGTGLGLFIVKAVAEAHGGKVELESAQGKGSTFRLFLPVR